MNMQIQCKDIGIFHCVICPLRESFKLYYLVPCIEEFQYLVVRYIRTFYSDKFNAFLSRFEGDR